MTPPKPRLLVSDGAATLEAGLDRVMKLVECTRCGSKELFMEDGYVVCAYCQSQFSPQTGDLPPKETVIGVHSDIQALLQKCQDDPSNRRRYASLILDIDPTNREARKYLG
jgi:uncharacterized Zn finger protein (UPF0148 family)